MLPYLHRRALSPYQVASCLAGKYFRSSAQAEQIVDKHALGVTARSTDAIRKKYYFRDQTPSHFSTLIQVQLNRYFHHSTPLGKKRELLISTIKKMLPQLSPPGWTLLVIAALTIIMQTPNIYNPSAFMADFRISNKPTAQLIGRPAFGHIWSLHTTPLL